MLSTIVQNERVTNVICLVVFFAAVAFIFYLREKEMKKNDLKQRKTNYKNRERKGEWQD